MLILSRFIFSAKAFKFVGSWQLLTNFTGNSCFYVSHEIIKIMVGVLSEQSVASYIEFSIIKTRLSFALADNIKINFFPIN